MATSTTNNSLQRFEKVCRILEENNYNQERLIPILHSVQQEYRYLPETVLNYVANALNLSPARVYGVATFYTHFALKPKGKYIIKICDGTACHVKGSMGLYDTIAKVIGLQKGQNTTDDLLFTLETVSCLGACGLAPVMVINDDVYGQMTNDMVKDVIEKIKAKEAGVRV